jgi:hypothetical protein
MNRNLKFVGNLWHLIRACTLIQIYCKFKAQTKEVFGSAPAWQQQKIWGAAKKGVLINSDVLQI